MSLLLPCPGCGEPRRADKGHRICRECEGYRPLGQADQLTAEEAEALLKLLTARLTIDSPPICRGESSAREKLARLADREGGQTG